MIPKMAMATRCGFIQSVSRLWAMPMTNAATTDPPMEPMPPEDHHDERQQDHLDAHLRIHGEDGREQEPGERGQRRRAGEGQREDARHVDAETVEHLGVLDGGADDDAGAGPGEEEPDAEQEQMEKASRKSRYLG